MATIAMALALLTEGDVSESIWEIRCCRDSAGEKNTNGEEGDKLEYMVTEEGGDQAGDLNLRKTELTTNAMHIFQSDLLWLLGLLIYWSLHLSGIMEEDTIAAHSNVQGLPIFPVVCKDYGNVRDLHCP